MKKETESNGLAREYTGEHHDSFTEEPSQKIYHWYAENDTDGTQVLDKNNVIFADQCWQMIRTTDTGGVKMIYNGEVVDNQCLSTRGNHVGYGSRTSQSLNSNYWYGTDYTYDSVAKTFKVSGTTEQAIWNDNTWSELIGKYTCKSTSVDGTCTTLYLVESYNSTTVGNVISLNSNSNYSQFGTVKYGINDSSPSYIGYMYGDIYNKKSTSGIIEQNFSSNEEFFPSTTYYVLNSDFWFADNISYDSVTGKYTLVNPFQVASYQDFPNLIGKYTLLSKNKSYSSSSSYYIVGGNFGSTTAKLLNNGHLITDYEPILFGDSITDNGNGTYSLNNSVSVSLVDWYINYANYKNKYTCNGNISTCTNFRYILNTNSKNYKYVDSGEKILIGKDRNDLSLVDTILVRIDELIVNSANYSDYKYTCNNEDNVCSNGEIRLISSYTEQGYKYAPQRYFGSSVTWDGEKYTLVDPIEMENYNNLNNISTHHFFCTTYGQKVCTNVGYIYNYNYTNFSIMNYVLLENGIVSIDDVLDSMFNNNINSSYIKKCVDAWYKKILVNYDSFIEDVIYCNDRAIIDKGGWNPNGGLTTWQNGASDLVFSGNYSNKNSTIKCTNAEDSFSISNNKAQLDYKIGLLTMYEYKLLNNSNALKTGNQYWLMSASKIHNSSGSGSSGLYVTYVNAAGNIASDNNIIFNGLRPAISLKPGIEYTSGDGSMENPYIVKTE